MAGVPHTVIVQNQDAIPRTDRAQGATTPGDIECPGEEIAFGEGFQHQQLSRPVKLLPEVMVSRER